MKKVLPPFINKLAESYKSFAIDPKEAINKCLDDAIYLKDINAFITITAEQAKSKSLESTARYKANTPLSILDGVPIAIKDNFCVQNVHTTCASRMLRDFIPSYNATVYDRLQQQGAILIGKTNLDQFGMGSGTVDSYFGATKNIWNKDFSKNKWHIAGGSSGGSAVAVAADICYAALGSDTGGSTRNPASYCGIIGLKPTYGLVSRYGLIPLVNSMDVPGILTRSVDDCAIILNAIAGPDINDSTTIKSPYEKITLRNEENLTVKNIKVGIPKEYYCHGLSNEVLKTWMKIADLLEDAGAMVKQISLPNTSSSIFVYTILNQCEVASNMARYDGVEFGHRSTNEYSTEQLYAKSREEGFNDIVKNRILSGNFYLLRKNYDKYFQKALKVRRLIYNDFHKIFNGYDNVDIILTPTTLTDAPIYTDFIQNNNRDQCAIQDYCTQPANMAGIPALSMPIRMSSNNMPLSLQLMGSALSEQLLLNVAKWIEKQVNFPFFKYT